MGAYFLVAGASVYFAFNAAGIGGAILAGTLVVFVVTPTCIGLASFLWDMFDIYVVDNWLVIVIATTAVFCVTLFAIGFYFLVSSYWGVFEL